MGDRNDDERPWSGDPDPNRTLVEDTTGRRPFMRGIMVHSLMARGVAFEDAYLLANTIRDRLRSVDTVTKPEIARAVSELLGDAANPEEQALRPPDIAVLGKGSVHPFSKGVSASAEPRLRIRPSVW